MEDGSVSYFSDRELGERSLTLDEVADGAWGGLRALVEAKISRGWFGLDYPLQCLDDRGTHGTDRRQFMAALAAEVPGLGLSDHAPVPETAVVFDMLEFCHRTIAQPVELDWHDYYGHHHLRFNRETGQAVFRDEVNRILARQGLGYVIGEDGQVVRLGPEPARALVRPMVFRTGDETLDTMLEEARAKYFSPDLAVRKEALEKLWDAFERLKTVEPGKDKKQQAQTLLGRVSSQPEFVGALEEEALALTEIGNAYQIRHFETGKLPVTDADQIDYLIHRMFSFVWLCLKKTGRLR